MLVLFGSAVGIIQLFAPLVNEQMDAVQKLDFDQIANATGQGTVWLDDHFGAINFSGDERSNSQFVLEQLESSLKFEALGQRISGLLAQIGSLFFGIFSVVFMAFFLSQGRRPVSQHDRGHHARRIDAQGPVHPRAYQPIVDALLRRIGHSSFHCHRHRHRRT